MGAATAAALTRAGARVLDISRSSGFDLSRPDDVARAVAFALAQSPDIVVNNAGAFALARIEDAELNPMLAINVVAPFELIRGILPAMRERGRGHIVNVGSIADHVAFPENGAYAASKYALRGLHEVLREELRGSPIRATLISPAAVDTALWDGIALRPAKLSADAVADAILYAVTRPQGVSIDEIRVSRP